jgi:hypothetical protein
MTRYRYRVEGLDRNQQTWATSGTVTTELEGSFPLAVGDILSASFDQLTEGKAVYGQPGVGCVGPYQIVKLIVERQVDES